MVIDLDAACRIGEAAGQKVTSSAFFPPEMARVQLGTDVNVIASEQFEMWYFGLLLLQLCTTDAPTLWQSTQADNMLHNSDMHALAYVWDTLKLERIGQSLKGMGSEWTAAMDLVLWCLQGVAARRPCSFEAVFAHRLFNPAGELRFMQSEELWDDFVCRQAADLHAAIDRQDRHAVHELFTLGAVHIEMIDPSVQGCAIQPLIHAAYKGDAAIVRDILDLSAVRFVCEITDR